MMSVWWVLLSLLLCVTVAQEDVPAADAPAEDGEDGAAAEGEEEECEEAWEYIEFLKEDVSAAVEDILRKTLYEASERRSDSVLDETRSKALDQVIVIREAIIDRIKGIRKDSVTICSDQNINQLETLSQYRMDVMNILLELVNPGSVSVDQLTKVSELLLTFRMEVSGEVMRLLMLPQGEKNKQVDSGEECDCEFLKSLSQKIEDLHECAEAEGSGDEGCMAPAMYNMELIAANELIDDEVQNLYRSIISTVDGEERDELLNKLSDYKEIRNENEENIAKLMKPDQTDEVYKKVVTRNVKKTKTKVSGLLSQCLSMCGNGAAGCPEPGSCAVEVIEDTKAKLEEYEDHFETSTDPEDSKQFVRNELMKYIVEINAASTDIVTMKAMAGGTIDNCTQVKGEVYEKIKGPLWMLVNTTIFEATGEATLVQTMIAAMKEQLDELHNKYCQEPDIQDFVKESDDVNCEWLELEQTNEYLAQIDKIIEASLYKGKEKGSRTSAMMGFVEMRVLFDGRVTQLFKEGVVCPMELMEIKTVYMGQLNKCMAEFMNPRLDFDAMNRIQRITCAKELRDKIDSRMIKLLQFEVTRSLGEIDTDGSGEKIEAGNDPT